ncbi:hypothetical protein [Streptomyces viridochromogenes]|uniref:Putative protease n=1 Tax=Streptomyces viridochromogenes Tue57 TaxID=1160705 RepID=L8PJM5_STRVR|nr:hypothetical protein [Streptomyces viridochromogenes]ELS56213.1 putative protease [Streptomyces viridochromogenes Tue57]
MNEGKPAKAKWWSRPRPQGPSPQAETAAPTPDGMSGTTPDLPEATEPTTPAGARERGPGGGADGDFELARPEAGVADDAASAEGDFELARPAAGGTGGTGGDVTACAEGDFELARPVAAPASVPSADGPAVVAGEPADERPKPLHDPDPYSTPPYGEPGPWAPAPPVQHPATTPAHGTAVPMPPRRRTA